MLIFDFATCVQHPVLSIDSQLESFSRRSNDSIRKQIINNKQKRAALVSCTLFAFMGFMVEFFSKQYSVFFLNNIRKLIELQISVTDRAIGMDIADLHAKGILTREGGRKDGSFENHKK